METVLISLFAVVMLFVSTMIMAQTSLDSVNKVTDSMAVAEQQLNLIQRTGIDVEFVSYLDGNLDIKGSNTGQTDLWQFNEWDLLVQYQDGSTEYLEYTSGSPQPGQWSVNNIFMNNDQPELFDIGILNPDEYAIMTLRPSTLLASGQTVRILLTVPNGVSAQCLAHI